MDPTAHGPLRKHWHCPVVRFCFCSVTICATKAAPPWLTMRSSCYLPPLFATRSYYRLRISRFYRFFSSRSTIRCRFAYNVQRTKKGSQQDGNLSLANSRLSPWKRIFRSSYGVERECTEPPCGFRVNGGNLRPADGKRARVKPRIRGTASRRRKQRGRKRERKGSVGRRARGRCGQKERGKDWRRTKG